MTADTTIESATSSHSECSGRRRTEPSRLAPEVGPYRHSIAACVAQSDISACGMARSSDRPRSFCGFTRSSDCPGHVVMSRYKRPQFGRGCARAAEIRSELERCGRPSGRSYRVRVNSQSQCMAPITLGLMLIPLRQPLHNPHSKPHYLHGLSLEEPSVPMTEPRLESLQGGSHVPIRTTATDPTPM